MKASEDLKEMTMAKNSAESGLASAQKQVEDQLKIAKEQITDLKKKLAESERAKNVAK